MLGQPGVGAAMQRSGDPEVGNLHIAAIRHQDVAEFHVTMNEPGGVGHAKSIGDVRRDLCGTIRRKRTRAAQHIGHRSARYVFHHDVVGAALLAPVVDPHDVGVVEIGRRLGFATEALDKAWVVGELGEENLQRDFTIE